MLLKLNGLKWWIKGERAPSHKNTITGTFTRFMKKEIGYKILSVGFDVDGNVIREVVWFKVDLVRWVVD